MNLSLCYYILLRAVAELSRNLDVAVSCQNTSCSDGGASQMEVAKKAFHLRTKVYIAYVGMFKEI